MSHFLKGLSADKFNQKYPVGSRFNYFSVMGIPDSVEVVTRTEAWALGHGAVVVSVNGRAGGLSIEHMKPVKHIEELSKPVAWTDAEELRGMAKDGCGYLFKVDPKNPFTDPRRQIMLYPQAYVDALLAKLEAAEARLLVPVKLPADEIGEAASFMSAAEVIPVSIVIARIKAAGYQVEGGVDNDH
ncbi:hypothetical protein CBW58_05910 [Yersinia frederiksenii]|nr:hypothetical protein CBW58_05910 [Yersinia frederiksenii]